MLGEFLNITNIGTVKSASVRLDGLSVVTGKNDTGKSTLGKVIFSIVKAFSRYKEDFQNNKEQEVFEQIEELYFKIRSASRGLKDVNIIEIRKLFFPPRFIDEVKSIIINQPYENFDEYEEFLNKELNIVLQPRVEYILKNFDKKSAKKLISIIEKIKKILLQPDELESQIKNALTKAFVSEFYSQITPLQYPDIKSAISYYSGGELLKITIRNNHIISIKTESDYELFFKDVTYIESPVYLQLSNLIENAGTLLDIDYEKERSLIRRQPKTSLHIKDLVVKLEQSIYFSDLIDNNINFNLLKRISNIIKGCYVFDEKKSEFIFKRNKKEIKALNTASGMKSFGIIQLLLHANAINERTLLIIDEPENHLHPEWQVKYADVLTELVKENISVIINSHSPYMIQALNHFSEKKDLNDKTNFYLAERIVESGMVEVRDVTENTDEIFKTLAEPLNRIM